MTGCIQDGADQFQQIIVVVEYSDSHG